MARHGRGFPIKAHINYQGRTGIYFNKTFARSVTDSILNGASRLVTVTRAGTFTRTVADSIMNAASRLVTLAYQRIHPYITLYIEGVDQTAIIDWTTLRKTQISTKEPDTLSFDIRNYPSKTYQPALGDDVTLYDTDGLTIIFGGVVINTEERIDGLLKYLHVECKDYTHTLDRYLVLGRYEGETVSAIISDILTNYTDGTFTMTGVTDTTVVELIVFNYLTVSEALKKLAITLGDYSWYVDYEKDIHFYANSTQLAPFNLLDDSENFDWNSLEFTSSISQIRNSIVLRGGTTTGTAFTDYKIADGQQNTFFVGYDLVSYTFYKALAATPSTFVTLTVGADGVADPTTVDVLYNPVTGLIRFANANTPAVNDVIKWTGTPTYPLIAKMVDAASVSAFGIYEYVIVDKNIQSTSAASQRLSAELAKWAGQVDGGSFTTRTSGLLAGQQINVTSVIRGVSKDFKIDRIVTTMHTPSSFKYDVKLVTKENVTMNDVLNKLLVTNVSDQINIDLNEILQSLYVALEEITFDESFTASISHEMQNETISLVEEVTAQALDYPVVFVAGPWTPSGFKRGFILNGSPTA